MYEAIAANPRSGIPPTAGSRDHGWRDVGMLLSVKEPDFVGRCCSRRCNGLIWGGSISAFSGRPVASLGSARINFSEDWGGKVGGKTAG